MNVIYKTVSDEDMRVHTRRQSSVTLAGRMLVSQGDVDVAVPASVEELGKRGTLLGKDREPCMAQVMELEPRNSRSDARFLPRRPQRVGVNWQAPGALGV